MFFNKYNSKNVLYDYNLRNPSIDQFLKYINIIKLEQKNF